MNIRIPDSNFSDLGLRPPTSLREFKGVNLLNPFAIDKTFATRTRNLTGAGYPAIKTRPGYTVLGGLPSAPIMGLGAWKDSELHAICNGNWYKWNGSGWQQIDSGYTGFDTWQFTNFKGNFDDINLIATNGTGAARKYSASGISFLGGIPAGAKYIDQHDNRLYAARENQIFFCALRKGEDWTTVDEAGEIAMETNTGELISGLRAGSKHLLAFKKSTVFELYGTGPLNYRFDPIASDIGLIADQAITVMDGITYWVDQNSIYMYGGARPRDDFAIPVRSYITGMNKAAADKVSVGSVGKTLFVSVPSAGSSVADTTLEYNSEFNTWYVWTEMNPTHYQSVQNTLYAGDSQGRVLKLGDGATNDNGASIFWEWVSPPIGGGTFSQRIRWYHVWYVVDVPIGSTINLYLSKEAEGESWTYIKTLTSSTGRKGRIMIPIEAIANANWIRFRLTGDGPAALQEFNYDQRDLPLS